MTPERWREVEEVFQVARGRAPNERAAYLDQACGADAELRGEVESLLAADDGASGFLEPSPAATSTDESERMTRLAAALAGRYTLERELGRGGTATVYLARDLKHDRLVALKVLKREVGSLLGPDRFLREIRTAARLHHPHILQLHDSGEAGGLLYYVMPLVEGETLRQRLRREGRLPIEETLRITRELADALDYAHRHGLVHRDVKPENVLLADGHALLADFGIAKPLDDPALADSLTQTGFLLGTPAYMSPEQASGGAVDGRSDQYSLACVVHEVLTGEPPFTGPTPQAVIAKRFREIPPEPERLRNTAPPAVRQALRRALAIEPEARFATTGEFARAFSDPALPMATAITTPASDSRRRRFLWLAGLMVVGAVAAGVLSRPLWRGGRSSQLDDAPARLAVLPFEAAGDTNDRAFADGMSEELTSRLARVPGLMLVARSSALQYRRSGQTAPEFGRALGVDYVLDGTVRSALGPGGQKHIRITPELIHVADGTRVWGEPYAGGLADVFQLQADLAEQVAEALHGTLSPAVRQIVRNRPTGDVEAYRLYLLGRFEWNHRTPDALERATTYFRQAVARDSSFARAWAGLADAYAFYPVFRVRTLSRDTAYAWATSAAQRAIALDSTLSEPHASLMQILRYWHWDWPGSEREARRAIELDPNYATAHQWLAEHLLNVGRVDESFAEARTAVRLDPLSSAVQNFLGNALWVADRDEEAINAFRAASALDPAANLPWLNLVLVYLSQGRSKEALGVLVATRDTSTLDRQFVNARSDPRARTAVLRALARGETPFAHFGWEGHFARAVYYGLLGERDLALTELERAVGAADSGLEGVKVDPVLAPFLQGEPRYKAVLRAVRLLPEPGAQTF